MRRHFTAYVCVALAGTLAMGSTAFADVAPQALAPTLPVAPAVDQMGHEMTVNNWILCTSEDNAESIAKARADGVEPALKVYADLEHNRACGVFPVLRVILEQSLYDSGTAATHRTRVYRASVNVGGGWPTGFVIYGGLAD